MSNTQVGNVYQQIISDVIDSSRVDFEEGGVDENVLEELKLGWQQKLSQLQVAQFPWDPKVEPQPPSNPPTVPSNAGNYQSMGTPPIPQPQGGLTMPQNGGPRIKTEPGLDMSQGMTVPQQQYQAQMQQPTAAQRAAQHLQNNFGPRAAASISAITGAGQNGQQMTQAQAQAQAYHQAQMRQAQPGMQQGQPQRPPMSEQQYRAYMAANASRNLQQQQAQQQQQQQQNSGQQNGLGGAQTDGAGDDGESYGVIKQYGPNGEEIMGRIEIDGLIRAKIEAMGTSMEGGGLMMPLRQASTPSKRQHKAKRTGSGVAQNDGGDDDDVKGEDLDEDAINSDLDDPDDGQNDEEDEDEGMGHIMLCMYDKVQRVKNKWKCVMKDGVLTVNGKEYVFHKATGEYEW